MAVTMSRKTKDEYLVTMRERYTRMTGRQARSKLLDEFCKVTGHERKYATKLLGGRRRSNPGGSGRGRPAIYGEAEKRVITAIWKACEQPCGKRLKAAIRDWLPAYEKREGLLDDETRTRVLAISPAQIDRLLASGKVSAQGKYRPGLKANAAVKAAIPIRAESWDTSEPGWTEADTVALCGGSMQGDFAWALTCTDIATGWTEARATWNRGQHGVCEAFTRIEAALPFAWKGVDTDNGGEFLNWHLVSHLADRNIAVEQTRSRPYHKNDQAHIEQKNYTHVRALLGYDRIGYAEVIDSLDGLLAYWSLWNNLYSPTMRQVEKTREKGGRVVRRHEKESKTPCQRVLESGCGAEIGAALEEMREQLDPFVMKERIEKWLKAIWELVEKMNQAQNAGKDPSEEAAAWQCPGLRYAPSGALPRAYFRCTVSAKKDHPKSKTNPKKTNATVPTEAIESSAA